MPEQSRTRYDIAFRNATIIDGTGAARFAGDVAVNGDRIDGKGDAAFLGPGSGKPAPGTVHSPSGATPHAQRRKDLPARSRFGEGRPGDATLFCVISKGCAINNAIMQA